MKKTETPNTTEGYVKLLIEHFPEEHCCISKSIKYCAHSKEIEIVYSVYISNVCDNFELKSFEAVRKYIELAILNKSKFD